MTDALVAIQLLNAILVAGGNMTLAMQRLSALIQQRHAAGGHLSLTDLDELFDKGEELEQQNLAKARAALAAPK